MSPRDTRTGGVLESMVLPALKRGGYEYETQKNIGERPSGRKHKVDIVAMKGRKKILVSLKWQQTSGTAEQKVPFEIICLVVAVGDKTEYSKAYLVLGGDGWSLRDYYCGGHLKKFIEYDSAVEVVTLEKFIGLANKGKL